ncbi:helix-turn-helix domain-containing protein [Natrarchaeobius halalkaliphilus]|nr:helix-turn-helix domain-containing protein [Natrarchaeobius halalkaliphilus]
MTVRDEKRPDANDGLQISAHDIDVLLVDDDEAWVGSTGTVLEHQREAFSVTTATTLESAFETFVSQDPDCVVCDYQLEYGTGLELLAEVREIDPDRPFLLVTGAGSEGIASDAIGHQVTDYLPKRSLAGRDDVLARRIEATVHSYRTERALARERRSKEAMLEIVTATTSRDGLTREFCQHLVTERDYDVAWIGTRDGANGLAPQETVGIENSLNGASSTTEPNRDAELIRVALERQKPVVAAPTPHDESDGRVGSAKGPTRQKDESGTATATTSRKWFEIEHDRDDTGAAVPIEHDGTAVGVLAVYANDDDRIDGHELDVLLAYGRTIGYALRTAEWKQSLVSATPVVIEFEFTDERAPLLAFAAKLPDGATIDVLTAIVLEDGLCYIARVQSVSSAEIQNAATEVESVTSNTFDESTGRCELVVSTPTPEGVLAEHGMRVLETGVERGRGIVTVVCPDETNVQELATALQERYPTANVGSIRSKRHAARRTKLDELIGSMTDKQLQAIELAFYSGYFERPREHNTTEIASKLGVSRTTFTQHLRAAERKLLTRIFDPPE